MSIFKTRTWWSNEKEHEGALSEGFQNGYCLKVDKIGSHNDSDCIIVAEGVKLNIYKPYGEHQASHLILESRLNSFILQVETGKFITGSEERQVIVLHPHSYSIYSLQSKEGQTEAGIQNTFTTIINNSFTTHAYSLICGHFGNTKSRELICVQAIDGGLSFFDQDIFLFTCPMTDTIIPTPICYITSCDSFVICKSTWALEIYSYQQLKNVSEATRHNKKVLPQWAYNVGEEISFVQVIQTSNNFSSIIVIGERYLYCFQDNGLMKFMKKLDYTATCFSAYLIGWYYEPGARLLLMVASEDSNLYIYENTSLLWSCDLGHVPIAISRCFAKGLSGGVVTLSTTGIVTVSFLGTEPDLSTAAAPSINEPTDPEVVQAELNSVEESLKRLFDNEDQANDTSAKDYLDIKINVGQPIQNLYQEPSQGYDEALHLLMSPILVTLTFHEPKSVQSVQVTYVSHPPLACSDTTICLDEINGTEILETQVFVLNTADISNIFMEILFTVTNSVGKILVHSEHLLLPLRLICSPTDVVNSYNIKIDIQSNNPKRDLIGLFSEFKKEDFSTDSLMTESITFIYRATKKIIKITSFDQQYCIEAMDFPETIPILEHLIYKLNAQNTDKENAVYITLEKEFNSQVIHIFLKCIEVHAKARIKMKQHEDDLCILQKQFTLVQKRLLVQYGSLPPGDCEPLEFLMNDTFKRLTATVDEIIQSKEGVNRSGSSLQAVGRLIMLILKLKATDQYKIKLIEEMFSLNSLYDDYQQWEEAVSQSVSYIHNTIFKKSEKDKEKLAPVTEQGVLSHINLKRFLKQIKVILDQMFAEALDGQSNDANEVDKKIVRLEEFVEVI